METEPYCTFHLGQLYLGVEARRVHEVLRGQEPTEVPLADPCLCGLINLRGHIVPVLDLRVRLALPPAPEGAARINVLVRTPQGPVGLLVDAVGDVREVSMDHFEAVPETLQGPARQLIRGAFKLPDRLLLSLDADRAIDVTASGAAAIPGER